MSSPVLVTSLGRTFLYVNKIEVNVSITPEDNSLVFELGCPK